MKHQKYTSAGAIGLQAIDETKARPANMTSTPYAYKYNGQEWQDELGLNMYDMDMRQYDPAIARWVVLDPVIHHSMSPYNAFDNNPVFWADPSGADAVGSVFQDLGTEVASITNISSGFELGAGGAEGSSGGEEGAKAAPTKDPGKKSWFGRMISKIGKIFSGGKKVSGGVDQSSEIEVMGITDDVSEDSNSLLDKSIKTVSSLANAYTGYNEFAAGVGLILTPEPTMATKVGGIYLAADGTIRALSTTPTIYGIWTNNETLANLPSNLLGVGGNVFDNIASSEGAGFVSGGDAQLAGELIGDFGLSKRNLINTLTGKSPTSKMETLTRGAKIVWGVIGPYVNGYNKQQEMQSN